MKIATKYLLFVLVPVMISVIILSLGLYLRSSQAIKKEVDRRLFFTARQLKDLIDGDIERVKGDLITILANKSLEVYFMYLNIKEMDYVEDARATLEENFLKIAEAKPEYATLRVFRSDGTGIVNITDKRASHKYPDPTKTEWFKSGLRLTERESYISGVHICSEHKHPSIFLSHPYYYQGKLQALGSLHLHMQHFFGRMLKEVDVGKSGYAYLVDSRGFVVTHKDPERVETDVNGLESTMAVLNGKQGTLIERDEAENILMKKFYLPLGIKGVGIIVAQPLKEAMAVSTSVKWYVIGIASIATIFLFLLIFLVSKRIVIGPVRKLSTATNSMLMGDLTARVGSGKVLKCWEIKKCGREDCPAFNDMDRPCWQITDTKGSGYSEEGYAKKLESCLRCEVYQRASGDEIQDLAESFNVMAVSLNEHISGIEETKERLKQQGQLLQTILDATPDIVGLQDRESVYKAVNKAFCQFVKKKEKDIIGKTDFDLFPEDLAEKNLQENTEVMKTGKSFEKQEEIEAAGGSRWLHVIKIPVHDPNGNITGTLWSGRDITELKQIQAKLVQSQKMESIGRLAAGIAHEINTPLGIILGYAQLLKEDFEEDSPVYQDIQLVEKHSKICRKITADLLKFSRHTERILTSVNINQCIDEVVAVLRHTFSLDRIAIEKYYDADLPPVLGDKGKFKQVFINLLSNAYDAIGTDGTISITTNLDPENNDVVISVADTGKGISPENMDRIFDPFFTTKSVGKGTGLGLSVTFGIIQEHGGKIEVKSPLASAGDGKGSDARGTALIIYLPVSDRKKREETGDGKNIGAG